MGHVERKNLALIKKTIIIYIKILNINSKKQKTHFSYPFFLKFREFSKLSDSYFCRIQTMVSAKKGESVGCVYTPKHPSPGMRTSNVVLKEGLCIDTGLLKYSEEARKSCKCNVHTRRLPNNDRLFLDQYCLTRIVFLSAQCPQQEDILRKVI
jgi:hypothetical protein